METAILGGGCFWCLEAVYRGMKGILSIAPGYAGGTVQHPTYQQVCTGQTGHAEVIRLEFDPAIISYAEILRIFFVMHDPTTLNRQGNDKGTQYRSVIFYENDQQKQLAERAKQDITQEKIWGDQPVVTQIQPLTTFWPAEEAHFDYYARNPMTGYCQVVISPKVAKARKEFARYFNPA